MNGDYWFELAVVFFLLSVGGIVFAPFATDVPIWQRLLKLGVGAGVAVTISAAAGRGWFFGAIGVVLLAVAVIHGWWLPRNGVNGWTAEPRERYHALRGWTGEKNAKRD